MFKSYKLEDLSTSMNIRKNSIYLKKAFRQLETTWAKRKHCFPNISIECFHQAGWTAV